LKREKSDQTTQNIVDQDTISSNLNLNIIRDFCYSYKQQRAEKTKRQLEKKIINRVETK